MSQPDSAEQRPAIAAAVIVHDGAVLLVKRRISEGSLSWQFPAGAVEPNESAADAAVREAKEETGLVVEHAQELGQRVHPNTGRTMIYIACRLVEGDARVTDDDELADIAWATRQHLADYVPHGFYGPVQTYLDAELTN